MYSKVFVIIKIEFDINSLSYKKTKMVCIKHIHPYIQNQ